VAGPAGRRVTSSSSRARAAPRQSWTTRLFNTIPGPGAVLPAAGAALQDPTGLPGAAPLSIDEAEWPTAAGEVAHLQVQVIPLLDDQQALPGAGIGFADVTRSRRHKEELEHANQGLEDAYAELQSTNGELQTINDEVGIRTTELDHLQPLLDSGKTLRGSSCGGAAAGHAGGAGLTGPRRARRLVRVRGLEPLTRRLAADVADLGAP
jgi:hypothetical protein